MRKYSASAILLSLAVAHIACTDTSATEDVRENAPQQAVAAVPDAPQNDEPQGDPPVLKHTPPRGLLDREFAPAIEPPVVQEKTKGDSWRPPLSAFRQYLQPVEYPNPPQLAATRQMRVVSMQELQDAVASNTVVTVAGIITATESDFITIGDHVHDLIIRFEPNAEIRYAGGKTYSGIFRIAPTVKRVRFESVTLIGNKNSFETCAGFEFLWDDSPDVVEDVAIVEATLIGLNYAIQGHNGCKRLLIQDCLARGLIDYFYYGAKRVEDLTIQGCTAHGVRSNHVIRMFDANRVNIFRNDLMVDSIQEGQMKRTIWVLTGTNVTLAGNRTHDGRVTIGPNPVASDSGPDDRIGNVNIVFNRITHTHTNTPIELLSGAHDVFLTDNVIDTFTDAWLGIGGWNEHRRPITNIRWTNGMILNGGEMSGRLGVEINEHYARQADIGVVAQQQ